MQLLDYSGGPMSLMTAVSIAAPIMMKNANLSSVPTIETSHIKAMSPMMAAMTARPIVTDIGVVGRSGIALTAGS